MSPDIVITMMRLLELFYITNKSPNYMIICLLLMRHIAYDNDGKKKILLMIMIFYTAGVSIAGFSTNLYFMLIARALQGVGMSMFPIAFSIVRAQFPREKIAIGQGIITSMFAGGAVIGLTIGGFIIQD
ncbi:MAG: MFS transporter [Candidatus Nitrosopolaris sp.]